MSSLFLPLTPLHSAVLDRPSELAIANLPLAARGIFVRARHEQPQHRPTLRNTLMLTTQESSSRDWLLLFLAWLVAAISTLSALFLGEVMGYTPCVLCWYQRIAMFPLVLVLAAGLFPFDPRVVRYALPLVIAGWGLAVFHLALIAGWVPEAVKPCQTGVPCSDVKVVWFGFVTIPLLSVLSFSLLAGLLRAIGTTRFRSKS